MSVGFQWVPWGLSRTQRTVAGEAVTTSRAFSSSPAQ